MASAPINFLRAMRFGVLELALCLLGMLFIRREVWQLHAMTFDVRAWQEWLVIGLSAVDGALTGAFASSSRVVQNEPAYKNALAWGTPLFFVLYVGCASLCERINFGCFPTAASGIVRTIGVTVTCAGMLLRMWSFGSAPLHVNPEEPDKTTVPTGPHKLLRHADLTGKLISLIGFVLAFNVWLPLFALPGIVILLKWHISDQESFRISQLGEPYLAYREKTWNLIPYLY